MIEFEIKSKIAPLGDRKGQTVYYAYPKAQQKLTTEMVIKRIVNETSLSEGDVKNALVSLSNVVCDAMQMGMSVDLAELGSFRLVVPSKMMDAPDDVTVAKALKTPKIVFTPKQKMRDAANAVELSVDKSSANAPCITGVYDLTTREKNRINRQSYAEVNGRHIQVLGADGVSAGEIILTSVGMEGKGALQDGRRPGRGRISPHLQDLLRQRREAPRRAPHDRVRRKHHAVLTSTGAIPDKAQVRHRGGGRSRRWRK